MNIRFWGVRGSIPAPGPETNRYGGNTCCVSVRSQSGHLLVLDMGTGLLGLGESLLDSEFGRGEGAATLLLSHVHWDHIQGFPFFPPIFIAGNEFELYGHATSSAMLEGMLEGQMNPHFSPIYTLKNLGAEIQFRALAAGERIETHGVTLSAVVNPHGATTCLAFRLDDAGHSVVYAPDVGYPQGGPTPEALELYRGADVLIHDCTYTPEERTTRLNRGLSSFADAAAVAVAAQVGHLVMIHYDQDHSDRDVDKTRARCRVELDRLGGKHIELTAASEGLELAL